MTTALALDLGTTRIKAAHLTEKGKLIQIIGIDAPALTGKELIREGDALAYTDVAIRLLQKSLNGLPKDIPIGTASQRSSFLLWEKDSGKPVTPLISWQDRRANDWCIKHQNKFFDLESYTGLLLSPHYVGPKLAYIFSQHPDLKKAANIGKLLFGTLDTFLIWQLTNGKYHQTDLSMAARTLMADPRKGEWSEPLLKFFDIPSLILPEIVPTFGRRIPLNTGGILTASVADQAAGVFSIIDRYSNAVLVNLGTGGFVIYPIGSEMKHISGYLCGPILNDPNQQKIYALEGTINGIADALSQQTPEPVILTEADYAPESFCLPDTSGAGSPFWRADIPFSISSGAGNLTPENLKRVVIEGIIFRINQILQDILIHNPAFEAVLCRGKPLCLPRIILSGGLSAENFISHGLASCTGFHVMKLKEQETTLTGAAMLAIQLNADKQEIVNADYIQVQINGKEGEYLKEKFLKWKIWLNKIM